MTGCDESSGVLEVERGPCGPGGVIGLVDGDVERHHHRVADEAVNTSTGGVYGWQNGLEVSVQHRPDDIGRILFRELGEALQIREEHCGVARTGCSIVEVPVAESL